MTRPRTTPTVDLAFERSLLRADIKAGNADAAEAQLERVKKIQTPACDRCTVGVMDATNPHLWGECDCECHA